MTALADRWLHSGRTALAIADGAFVLLGVLLSMAWIHRREPASLIPDIPSALEFTIVMVAFSGLLGIYSSRRRRSLLESAIRHAISLAAAAPLAYLLFEFRHTPYSTIAAVVVLAAARTAVVHADARNLLSRRVLIVGTGPEALAVRQSLQQSGADVDFVGFAAFDRPGADTVVPAAQIVQSGLPLVEVCRRMNVDEVVVALGERRGGAVPLEELFACRLAGLAVVDLSSHFESALGQVRLDYLRASWLVFGDGFRHGILRSLAKRLADIMLSAMLLLAALPLMLLAAVLIVLESGWPVLYHQERVGQAGRTFRVIKFRSMRTDAERDGTPRWAQSDDARITRVGAVIRKLRIDELPQLFNVLKGEMSLIGPRPERPYFVDQLEQSIPFYAARHSVKPGITGWAQVRFPYGASVDDARQKLQYDLYYVKNHSLLLDLLIVAETVMIVLLGKGR